MELMEVLRMRYERKKILLWYEDVFCGGWNLGMVQGEVEMYGVRV